MTQRAAVARRAPVPAPHVVSPLAWRLRSLSGTREGSPPRPLGVQRERHQPDHLILIAVVALTAIGVLMVYSSSGVREYVRNDDPFALVGPQIAWAILGIVAMVVMMRVDYRHLRRASVPLYLIALAVLVLVLVPRFSVVVGGSARFLKIGPLPAVHPAEIAKLGLVVFLAQWMARTGGRISSIRGGTIPFLVLAAPVVLLVLREPDLGTAGVLAITASAMFFVAGANLWQFALMIPAAAGALALVVSRNPYQLQRVQTFLDPWRDPQGTGFQTVQGLLALAQGGVTGTGLGSSRQPGGLPLPNAFNDFIFAVIGEELGFLGALLVVGLFVLLAYHGIRVALSAPDTFGGLLATGITAWLTVQALLNIGVVVAVLPITGITLPFVSAGGSSLVVSLAAVGILLSISRETQPRGSWNDADPDRRRRHRRPHLPGLGRRAVAQGAGAER